uniref:Secreted protein n=1 Tax=Achlya hypogyna TaxID=1202772 RepID=A0A0A7CNU6_ACHHY|nr:secreted protein [Achlya hypogyna]
MQWLLTTLWMATAVAGALEPCNFAHPGIVYTYNIIGGAASASCATAVGLSQPDSNKIPLDDIFTKVASPTQLSALAAAPACTSWWSAVTTAMKYAPSCSLGGVSLRAIQKMTIDQYFAVNNDELNHRTPSITTSDDDDVPALPLPGTDSPTVDAPAISSTTAPASTAAATVAATAAPTTATPPTSSASTTLMTTTLVVALALLQ